MTWRARVVPLLQRFCQLVVDEGPAAWAFAIDENGSELARAGDSTSVDTAALAGMVARALERLITDRGALIDVVDERQVHVRILHERVILVAFLTPKSRTENVAIILDEIERALAPLW